MPQKAKSRFPVNISVPALIPILLLVIVIVVFFPVCNFAFVNYDDNINIYENRFIIDFSLKNLLFFWQGPYEGLYIPIIYTVWGGLSKISELIWQVGLNFPPSSVYHSFNLLIHASNVLLIFIILRRCLKNDWASGTGALLFALHPVQVEAVAWATGLKDLLSSFFSLLAIWQYLLFITITGVDQPLKRKGHYCIAILCFVAAMLSKPSTVMLPLILAIIGYLLFSRKAKQLVLDLGPYLLCALPVIVITNFAQTEAHNVYSPQIWERFLIAGDAISFYIGKLFLPMMFGFDYGRTPQYILSQNWVYLSGLLPFLMTILLLWKFPKPWALTSTGLFASALLPVLGIIPFEFQAVSTVADRYLYLGMLGPALALGKLVLFTGKKSRYATIALLILLGLKSSMQVQTWQNSITFNTNAIQVNPQSSIAYVNLGIAFTEADRLQEATSAFQKSLTIANYYPHPYIYLADIFRKKEEFEQALHYYKIALEKTNVDSANVYFKIGLTFMDRSQNNEAISSFKKAIEMDPNFAEACNTLGTVYVLLNQLPEAKKWLQKAIDIAPAFAQALNNLSKVELQLNNIPAARDLANRAKSLGLDDPEYLQALQSTEK